MAERRTQTRGDQRRRAILDAALNAFAETGYYGASIAEIAAAAGISQAGMLHHFPSKPALLVAVLRHRDIYYSERAILSRNPPLRGIAVLRHQVDMVARNVRQHGLTRLLTVVSMEAINPDHPAHGWAEERYEWMVGWLINGLRLGIEDGTVRADTDCEDVARTVFAMMDGLQLQWLLLPGQIDMLAIFTRFIDELILRISVP